ncbi:MAG: hypothetical protein WCH86_06380 [Kiritimatiellales bacterium]
MEESVNDGDDTSLCRTLWLMTALFAITAAWMIFFQPLEKAVAFAAMDDGLYYPRLAQNIIARGMCTYDGVTVTNGFHPLWLLVLLPVYGLIHNPWLALRGVYAVILITQLASIVLLAFIARRTRMTATGLAVAVFILFLNIRSFTIFFSFLESPLVLFTLLSYLAFCLCAGCRRFENPRYAFIAGVLTGFCFLARLDSFLLPVAYGAVLLTRLLRHREPWRSGLLSSGLAAAGCLTLTVPYLLWNWITFGHLQTVSAFQKTASFSPSASWKMISGWCLNQFIPRVQHILGLQNISSKLLLGGLLLSGLLATVYLLTGARRRRLADKLRFCPEFPIFVGMHALFIVLAAPHDAAASAWYWIPELTLVALAGAAALPDIRWAGILVIPSLIILLVGTQLWIYPALVERKTMSWAKLEVARVLRENTPSSLRGAMFDSGIVSYFSQRDFTGLNGLIGDFEHAALMREKKYAIALERCGVGLLVLDTPKELIPELISNVFYKTEIETKFENFNEPPKPFVVYRGSPEDLQRVWNVRYGGRR